MNSLVKRFDILPTSRLYLIQCEPDGRRPGRALIKRTQGIHISPNGPCLRRCASRISKPDTKIQRGFAGERNVGEARAAARRTPRAAGIPRPERGQVVRRFLAGSRSINSVAPQFLSEPTETTYRIWRKYLWFGSIFTAYQ